MMSSPPDIKPAIASDSAPRPNPSPLRDIKPSLTDISRNGNPIDLTKHKHSILEERRKLEEEFRLRRTVLDLREESLQDKEEISRLKASLRVAKVEPGDRDIKPDISDCRDGRGGRNDELAGQPKGPVESDDDDIIFIREVKAKPRGVDLGQSPVSPSILEAPPPDLDCGSLPIDSSSGPITLAETDHHRDSSPPLGDAVDRQSQPTFGDHEDHPNRNSSRTAPARSSSSVSDTDSDSDTSDESFSAPITTLLTPYNGPAKRLRPTQQARIDAKKAERQELKRQKMHDTIFPQARSFQTDPTGSTRTPGQLPSGSHISAKDTDRATQTDDSLEASTSTDDEGRQPYRGPHLRTLSVKSLNDRLDRSIGKWGISSSLINDRSSWWPKTKVAKHHNFDAARIYLLTWSVHVWWSKLYTAVTSSKYDWPEGMGTNDKMMMISRIREIAFHKEGDAVRGEREMNTSGRKISAGSVIRLDK